MTTHPVDAREDSSQVDCAQEALAEPEIAREWDIYLHEETGRRLGMENHPTVPGTSRTLEDAISAFAEAHECVREAVRGVDAWHREKPMAKMAAIKRIMQDTNGLTGKAHSASSAESIAETDPEYSAYLERGTNLTLLRSQMEMALAIAEARMTFIARRTRSDF